MQPITPEHARREDSNATRAPGVGPLELVRELRKDQERLLARLQSYSRGEAAQGVPAACQVQNQDEISVLEEHDALLRKSSATAAAEQRACLGGNSNTTRHQHPPRRLTISALRTLLDEDPKALDSIFANVDIDRSGDLTYDEWERAFSADEALDETALRSFFDECDTNGSGRVSLEQFKQGLTSVQSVGKLDMIKGVMKKINLEDIVTTALGKIVEEKRPNNEKLLPIDAQTILSYLTPEDFASVWQATALPKVMEGLQQQAQAQENGSKPDVRAFNDKFALKTFEGKFESMQDFLKGGSSLCAFRFVALVYDDGTGCVG